jgi:hypothetical protein
MVENGRYYLLDPSLPATGDDTVALHRAAADLLTRINGIALSLYGAYKPVSLSGSFRDESGTHYAVAAVERTVRRYATATAVVTNGPPGPPLPEGVHRANLLRTMPEADKVFRLMGEEEFGWVTMYKVFEIIEDLADGQLHERGFGVTGKDIERFTRTAQPHRHGVVNAQPPKKPTELMEAQAFIRRLLDAWLR